MKKRIILIIGLLLIIGGFIFSQSKNKYDFTLTDQNNKLFRLSSYKGKYIHLDFSALWCGPCRSQAKYMKAVEEDWKDKNFISITILSKANIKSQKLWASQYQLKHVLGDNHQNVARLFNVHNIPVNIILNPDLTIAGQWTGAFSNKEGFQRKVKSIVPELFQSVKERNLNSIILYTQKNFKGKKLISYNSITSMKKIKPLLKQFQSIYLPQGVSVIFFTGNDFNGRSEILSGSDKNLNDNLIQGKYVSSIYIIRQ